MTGISLGFVVNMFVCLFGMMLYVTQVLWYMDMPQGFSDIFIHTKARVIFLVQNFELRYFWGFFEK